MIKRDIYIDRGRHSGNGGLAIFFKGRLQFTRPSLTCVDRIIYYKRHSIRYPAITTTLKKRAVT